MKKILALSMIAIAAFAHVACSKPMASASVVRDVPHLDRSYAAEPNDIYYAIRASLARFGYPVAKEDLSSGIIVTGWVPTTADSHFVDLFGRPDYGVTNSYYQFEIKIERQGGRSSVDIATRAKSLVAHLKSSGIKEKALLDDIGNFLRKDEPEITNLGIVK